eukprot:scaffold22642_cov134-Cylindrotheca_fusiformis.AAC.5
MSYLDFLISSFPLIDDIVPHKAAHMETKFPPNLLPARFSTKLRTLYVWKDTAPSMGQCLHTRTVKRASSNVCNVLTLQSAKWGQKNLNASA